MLSGKLPIGGEKEASILCAIVHKPPHPLRQLDSKINPNLERVVEKALSKNPEARYQSAGEFQSDIKALVEGLRSLKAKARPFRGKVLGIRSLYFYSGLVVLVAAIAIGLLVVLPDQSDVLDSIAILLLVNDSGDPSQDYFANSLTGFMISELYKVAALKVAPREAVMVYKNSTKSLQEKAKELDVKALVEASVLKSGNRIRLTASLIDPLRNKIIWSETLEKDYSDILILQSELCQAIVGGIRVAVNPEERERLAAAGKVNPEAYDLVMKGSETYWDFSGSTSFLDQSLKALDYFSRAIDIDPTLALAHSSVAFIYWSLGGTGAMDEKEAYPKAKEAVLKALELDDNLGHAHCMLGIIKFEMDWDFSGAESEWRRAAELAPGDWWVMNSVEQLLAQCGKFDEGIALFKHRVEEEEKAQSKKIYKFRGTVLYLYAGRFKEALENQKNVISSISDPGWLNITWLAISYAVNSMYSEAVAEIGKIKDLPSFHDDADSCADLAWIWAVSGYRGEALKELDKMKALMAQRNADPSYYAARVYAGLGENDRAFECLYQAYESHSVMMSGLISDYGLSSLHGDPRFKDLKKKVGFPEV